MSCACNGPPMMQPQMMAPQVSPQALKHQHVVNHLACRESVCPQGIDPHNVAVWGARRDAMERCAPCPEPVMTVAPVQQPVCNPCQMPMQQQCGPQGPGAIPNGPGWTSGQGSSINTVSFIDWGGRYSASPEYDSLGSPHGFYGPPAVGAMLSGNPCQMSGVCGQGGMPSYGGGGGMGGHVNHFGNAYPGNYQNSRQFAPVCSAASFLHTKRHNLQDTSQDDYYQKREHETRTVCAAPVTSTTPHHTTPHYSQGYIGAPVRVPARVTTVRETRSPRSPRTRTVVKETRTTTR